MAGHARIRGVAFGSDLDPKEDRQADAGQGSNRQENKNHLHNPRRNQARARNLPLPQGEQRLVRRLHNQSDAPRMPHWRITLLVGGTET